MNEQFNLFPMGAAPPPKYFDGPRVFAGDVQEQSPGESMADRLCEWIHGRQIRGATLEEAEQHFGRPLGVEWNQLLSEGRIADAGLLRPRDGAGYAKVFLSAHWARRRT
jgi:hypothetical protein